MALGIDDPLVRSIPDLWRNTPTPYGPLFLMIGRSVTELTDKDILLGVLAYRIVALAGLAMIVWALPVWRDVWAPTPTGRCGGVRPTRSCTSTSSAERTTTD
jgi:hypothetical protein